MWVVAGRGGKLLVNKLTCLQVVCDVERHPRNKSDRDVNKVEDGLECKRRCKKAEENKQLELHLNHRE
jgi:hypothetical protein